MLKKTVKYLNPFDDTEYIEEDVYFNFTQAELVELEMSTDGSLTSLIEEVSKTRDGKRIIEIFKKIVLLSYGKRDGNSFLKSDLLRERFAASPAYSEVFMELATDAGAASAFVNGILPKDLVARVQATKAALEEPVPVEDVALPEPVEETIVAAFTEKSQAELAVMTHEEFDAYFKQLRQQ